MSELPNLPDDDWYRGDTTSEPLLSRQIRRRIVAIEKTARKATAGPWHVDSSGCEGHIADPAGDPIVYHPDGGVGSGIAPDDAVHVGVWDPVRVLGFVKLASLIVAEHRIDSRDRTCHSCGAQAIPPSWITPSADTVVAWPCPTVRHLADFLGVATAKTYLGPS